MKLNINIVAAESDQIDNYNSIQHIGMMKLNENTQELKQPRECEYSKIEAVKSNKIKFK